MKQMIKWCNFGAVSITLMLFGCQTTQVNLPENVQKQVERIHDIDPVSLYDLSESQPMPLADDTDTPNDLTDVSTGRAESIELDLADIRASALHNNLDLQVELYNPGIMDEAANVERAKFETTFNGAFNYSEVNSPAASGLVGTKTDFLNSSVGIEKPLPTGGLINLDVPINRLDTDNPFSLLNPSFESDMRLRFQQPILRGAGLQTNTHSIRVAELQKQIIDARTKLEAIRVLANAERAYWLVYAASEELGVRLQQFGLAQQQLREANIRVRALVSPQIEITRAESGVASRLEAIIFAQTFLRRQERNLKRMINRPDLPLESDTLIVPKTPPNPMRLDIAANKIAQLAMENRMELLELELQLAQDESVVNFQKNARLPLFLLDYTYNVNGLGSDFGKSFEQVADRDFTDWQAGFRFEIPVGNKAARARLQQAVQIRTQRLATKEQRQQQIAQEVYDALDQLQQNWQRIHAAQQDVLFSERTFRAEKRQFEMGERTSTDVLFAAERLAIAQSREIQAVADYQITLVDVAFATGTLLGQANVSWEPVPLY